MVEQWLPAFVYLGIAAFAAFAMIMAGVILRVKAKVDEPSKYDTYECGEEPDGKPWIRFHPRYYVVALVFVLFDAETAFVLPWALNLRELGDFAIAEMFIFLAILMLGWLYAVRKGALQWQ